MEKIKLFKTKNFLVIQGVLLLLVIIDFISAFEMSSISIKYIGICGYLEPKPCGAILPMPCSVYLGIIFLVIIAIISFSYLIIFITHKIYNLIEFKIKVIHQNYLKTTLIIIDTIIIALSIIWCFYNTKSLLSSLLL